MGFKHYEDKMAFKTVPCESNKVKGFQHSYSPLPACLVDRGRCKDICAFCPIISHLMNTQIENQ